MGPLIIGGMIAGGIAGIASNEQRIKDQAREKRLLELQNRGLRRKMYATAAILQDEMTIGAMQATGESKKSAIQAYRAESAAAAGLGSSGIRGGTPYYMLDKALAEDKAALLEQADIMKKKFSIETQQGAMTINDIRDRLAMSDEQMAQINERLGYLSSPFAFMVSAATGAFSGGSIGANVQEFMVKQTGNAQWGEWPTNTSSGSFHKATPDLSPQLLEITNPLWKENPIAITDFSTIPQIAPAFNPAAPLQFGGQNISNSAKIQSPLIPLPGQFQLNLDMYDSPFSISGSKSGLRFNF